jgi:hypothetical protein
MGMTEQAHADRADRKVIEHAAAALRSAAIRDEYAGLTAKHLAFALALVLDELRLHLRALPADLRRQAVQTARANHRGLARLDAVAAVLGAQHAAFLGQ